MGVTACHTPFHTCFNRCKEPRRWGALRLFAFFYYEVQRSNKAKPSATPWNKEIRNAYESGRLPAICYYGVEANYVRLELCSPVGPGNSLVNPHVFITRGKYGGFRINRGLVFGKARHDRKNQRDRHCLRKQTIGTRYFQKPVGPLFA